MIFGASVIGREHVRLGKNNQDAWASCTAGETGVIVVADGCSSERSSEVGAQLGARWLAAHVANSVAPLDALAHEATRAFVAWLYRLSGTLGGELWRVVQDHLLFTFLCAVRRGDEALVFGVGDGVVLVDHALTVLDAGPDNAPEYVAYRLLGKEVVPRVHFSGHGPRRLALMTDGLSGVASSVSGGLLEGLGTNPYSLQRRLTVLSQSQRLVDDATIVVSGRANSMSAVEGPDARPQAASAGGSAR